MHVIQRILGHAQVSTTRIYTDPTDPLTREAADRIGRALWPDAELQPALQPDRITRKNLGRTPRSVRVRRQGLEPRTRGLRVRCSAN